MKYATYDPATGEVTGHYSEDGHGVRLIDDGAGGLVDNPVCLIPPAAIPITDEQWALSCQGQLLVDPATKTPYERPAVTQSELLEAVRSDKLIEVNRSRATAVKGGAAYAGNIYDSDELSRANLSGTVAALTAGIALPQDFTWRTSDNLDIPMDAAALVGLAGAILDHVNSQYQRSWQLKTQINAIQIDPDTTLEQAVAQIKAITW